MLKEMVLKSDKLNITGNVNESILLLTWTVSYVIIQFCLQVRWQTPDQDVNMESNGIVVFIFIMVSAVCTL